jgi:hypothetical protein
VATLTSLRRVLDSSTSDIQDEGFLNDLLKLFDVCLRIRLPDGIDPSAVTASNPATVSANLPPPFPRPGPILDAPRLDILQGVFGHFEAAKRTDKLTQHLEQEARKADESLRPGYLLARVAQEWWSGKHKRSLELLEQFGSEAHDDGGIGLTLVQGHLAVGDVTGAIRILERIRPAAPLLAEEADKLRADAGARLLKGNPNDQIQSLLLVLSNQTRAPDIKYLYEDQTTTLAARRAATNQQRLAQAQAAQLARLQAAQAQAPGQPGGANVAPGATGGFVYIQPTIAPTPAVAVPPGTLNLPPGTTPMIVANNLRVAAPNPAMPGQLIGTTATLSPGPMDVRRLLDLAREQNQLDAIERAASIQWEKHPEESRLGVLVALARFTRSDLEGATRALERWVTLLKTHPEIGGEPEAAWLASRCLVAPGIMPEIRALGRQIGREVVATARVRNFGLHHRYLLIQLLQASVELGQKEEALEELQLLKGLTGFNQGSLY